MALGGVDLVDRSLVLDIGKVRAVIDGQLSLPQQFRVETVRYFQRILPREYRAEDM